MTKEETNPIDMYMYHGIKIETPFEYYLRQRAADREARSQDQKESIELQAELLKLKYSEQQDKI